MGSEDIFAQPNMDKIGALLVRYDPGTQFEIIDGAAHWVMLDAPEEFNDRLSKMLKLRNR